MSLLSQNRVERVEDCERLSAGASLFVGFLIRAEWIIDYSSEYHLSVINVVVSLLRSDGLYSLLYSPGPDCSINSSLKYTLKAMRQLENVGETLVSSYFSSKDVVTEKFGTDLSSESPFWEDARHEAVPSLSDICIKVNSSKSDQI